MSAVDSSSLIPSGASPRALSPSIITPLSLPPEARFDSFEALRASAQEYALQAGYA